MIEHIIWALWFFAPAGAGNVAPMVAAHIPVFKRFDAPVDGGRTYRGQRIFGDHKTWRGFVAGAVFGVLAAALQLMIARQFELSFIPAVADGVYASYLVVALGALLGIGALVGDAVKSFFKRQIGVPPGKQWFPFDQLDYIIGACLASLAIVRLNVADYLLIAFVWFGIHLISSYIGYLIHWKQDPL